MTTFLNCVCLIYLPRERHRGLHKINKNSYLVTLDISSLHTNISHEDGIQASKYFLNTYGNYRRLSDNDIANIMKVVLENNYFIFDSDFFLQKTGTATGSSMAASHASLFMRKFEQDFLNTQALQLTLWLRFLDDIFFILHHSLDELKSFIKDISNFHPNIKFSSCISKHSVNLLHVRIANFELRKVIYWE